MKNISFAINAENNVTHFTFQKGNEMKENIPN